MIAPGLFFLNSGVRPWSKVAPTGVRPQSKVAGDCTLAPDPRTADSTGGLKHFVEGGGGDAFEVLLELGGGAGTDEDGGDGALVEDPGEGHLCQGLATALGHVVVVSQFLEQLGGEHGALEELLLGHAAVGGYALQIAVGEQALCQGREGDEADALLCAEVGDARLLRCAGEHVQASLIDEQGHVVVLQVLVAVLQGFEGPVGDADVEGLALAHDVDEGLQRLFEGCVGVVAVAVEEVDIVDLHAAEALVERCHEVLARAPVAVRPRPHVVACLRRDEEFVAVGAEVFVHQSSHGLFG